MSRTVVLNAATQQKVIGGHPVEVRGQFSTKAGNSDQAEKIAG